MEVQHHKHTHHKRLIQYFWDFFMLFLAISLGFVVENRREHFIEHRRMIRYLGNVLLDVKSNINQIDSLTRENGRMLVTYDSLLKEMMSKPARVDRFRIAKTIFPVYMRLFKNRNETYKQMLTTGSLRYLDNVTVLNSLVSYNRLADLTEWRAMDNERKIALEQNFPVIYKNFDAACLTLDIPGGEPPDPNHIDILKGEQADNFCNEVGKVFISRLRFIRLSYDTDKLLKNESSRLVALLEDYIN